MINLFDKSRTPNYKNEILTKSFLIDKIANEMKMKYKKVFSLINYDEYTLKNDIHNLLSKYISNRHKEINIKFIETTILNKVRQKYKVLKAPLNPVNKNKNINLIKIINSSPNKANSYLNINKNTKTISASKKNKKYLSPIKNKSNSKNDLEIKINQNYYTNQEKNITNNENINNNINNENKDVGPNIKNDEINNEINEENINNINEKQYDEEDEKIKKNILLEEEEIKVLEKYKQNIQNEINEINEEIKNQEKIKELNKQLININQENEKQEIKEINDNKIYDKNKDNNNNSNTNLNNNELIYTYNPSMTFAQMQYLERKKRIEEDFYNKQNRYIFLKPKNNKKEENEEENTNKVNNNIYKFDNIKINKYSMDKLNEFYKIKEKIRQEKEKEREKEKEHRYKSAKNIYEYKENNEENKNKKEIVKNVSYEDKIQLRILQRSLDQEKAIEHLRNILYPQKQLIEEIEYQGFNNGLGAKNLKKKREYELADEARRIQIEKMRKLLDNSIGDKKKRKYEEEEMERKYREMLDKDHELYLQKEKQKKIEKDKKIEDYRKMLDEQIQAKNKLALEDDNNFLELNKDLAIVE